MSIHLTDHRGYDFNGQNDVLTINTITASNIALNTTNYEILPNYGFPFTNPGTTNNFMVKINTTDYFSNRLFRIGDKILIRNASFTGGTNSAAFNSFLNSEEGHTIINLDVQTDTATGNKSYIKNLYIAPPGYYNPTGAGSVVGYYDISNAGVIGTQETGGVLLNSDLQCNLMFRIITRDADTSIVTQPINA
jgi:hypothetical protein